MIDKTVLSQIGFKKGANSDHEVWYHDTDFWVHFGGEFSGIAGQQISGDASMSDFFTMFISNIEKYVMDRARVSF